MHVLIVEGCERLHFGNMLPPQVMLGSIWNSWLAQQVMFNIDGTGMLLRSIL